MATEKKILIINEKGDLFEYTDCQYVWQALDKYIEEQIGFTGQRDFVGVPRFNISRDLWRIVNADVQRTTNRKGLLNGLCLNKAFRIKYIFSDYTNCLDKNIEPLEKPSYS